MENLEFYISKLAGWLISPVNLMLVLAVAALAMPKSKWLRRIGILAIFAILVAAFFPVGGWMMVPLENRFTFNPPGRVEGIIMLSGDERPSLALARDQPAMGGMSAKRYLMFAEMARKYPNARLAFSGGDNSVISPDQAGGGTVAVAHRAFAAMGLEPDRIIYEGESKTTRENAVYAAQKFSPRPDENWLLVTSAFHMPRALMSFRRAGWNVYPAPAGYLTTGKYEAGRELAQTMVNLANLNLAAHEYYGLIYYHFRGWLEW